MPDKGFRVTVEDLDTGEAETRTVAPGDFVLIPLEPCHLSSVSRYEKSGTVQLTLKDHRPQPKQEATRG
ncbi:hypothetical protein [Amycolatopsis thermoflava]|uniref:hypothetical protein n=1 Tax=Amycolatopsis thermoflava TaxID=84480 RepID=UPI003F4A5178